MERLRYAIQRTVGRPAVPLLSIERGVDSPRSNYPATDGPEHESFHSETCSRDKAIPHSA